MKKNRPGGATLGGSENGAATKFSPSILPYRPPASQADDIVDALLTVGVAIETTPLLTQYSDALRVQGPGLDLAVGEGDVLKLTVQLEQSVAHIRAWHTGERMTCYTVSAPFLVQWSKFQ